MTPTGNVAAGADSIAPDRSSLLEALLNERYSCRGFRREPLARATIERILTLAQRTASWCNAQGWQVVVTSGAGTDRFRTALLEQVDREAPVPDFDWPRQYLGEYLTRRRECAWQLYGAVGIARDDRSASGRQTRRNFELFDAPHVAIITSPEPLGTYGAVDCGAYVANFMLAARSVGVASIAQAALASQSSFVRSFFAIPDDRRVVCGISFGYEDPAHPANQFRTPRAAIADAVRWCDE